MTSPARSVPASSSQKPQAPQVDCDGSEVGRIGVENRFHGCNRQFELGRIIPKVADLQLHGCFRENELLIIRTIQHHLFDLLKSLFR